MKIRIISALLLLVTIACGRTNDTINSSDKNLKKTGVAVTQPADKGKLSEITPISGKTSSITGEVRSFQNAGRFS